MSSERTWETGEPDFELPVGAVVAGSAAMPSPAVPLTLTAAIDPFFLTTPRAYATDADGHLVWYDASPEPAMLTRFLTGGTFLSVTSTEVREVDLIGNVVRESNWVVLNQELRRRGEAEVLGPHHEALRLPDGRTAILVTVLQNLAGVQSPDLITVIGDAVLVLNDRFQLEWVWNAFDHLDVRRPPALAADFCAPGAPLCSGVPPATRASDWLHSNALTYSPDDGNLLISVRNQDWIVKIDYSDGVGSGEVLWRLGEGGDFQLEASGPWPWFSHQHAPSWRGPGQLLVYDNGNTRCEIGGDCRSRGQLYEIDEATRQARLVLSIPLHEYSFALGNTQALPDGVLHFGSGWATHDSRDGGVSEEFGPGGELRYGYFAATRFYRSYRLVDLYTAPAP
jgi:hypothetical protein